MYTFVEYHIISYCTIILNHTLMILTIVLYHTIYSAHKTVALKLC